MQVMTMEVVCVCGEAWLMSCHSVVCEYLEYDRAQANVQFSVTGRTVVWSVWGHKRRCDRKALSIWKKQKLLAFMRTGG